MSDIDCYSRVAVFDRAPKLKGRRLAVTSPSPPIAGQHETNVLIALNTQPDPFARIDAPAQASPSYAN
jgi:hypothetical protein